MKKSKVIRSFRRLHEKQLQIESKTKTNIAVLFLPKYTYTHTSNRNKERICFSEKISNQHKEQKKKLEIIDRRDCSTDSSNNNIHIYSIRKRKAYREKNCSVFVWLYRKKKKINQPGTHKRQ